MLNLFVAFADEFEFASRSMVIVSIDPCDELP
jgi:hypothetical protein